MDFEELVARTDLSHSQIAAYLEITPRTLYRWIKSGAPGSAWRALEYRSGYHQDWPGYRFQKGFLLTPSGHTLRAIEIDQIQWFNRMHYSNGQDKAETRLKAKVESAANMSQIALDLLKREISETMERFDWSTERYFNGATNLQSR